MINMQKYKLIWRDTERTPCEDDGSNEGDIRINQGTPKSADKQVGARIRHRTASRSLHSEGTNPDNTSHLDF